MSMILWLVFQMVMLGVAYDDLEMSNQVTWMIIVHATCTVSGNREIGNPRPAGAAVPLAQVLVWSMNIK